MKQKKHSWLLFLLSIAMISVTSNAQTKNKQLLNVYKVDFGYCTGLADTKDTNLPMYV